MAKSIPIDPSTPQGTADPKQGDDRIRETKAGLIELVEVDHYVGADSGSGYDENAAGEHLQATLHERSSPVSVEADKGVLFAKEADGIAELHYIDENEDETQITEAGRLKATPAGTITMFGGTSAPTGWLLCQGQEVSQTTYAALYAALGSDAFGTDAGGNFYLPDMKGRVPLGVGTGDAADATDHTRGEKEGTETHTLTGAEMPEHNHGIYDNGGSTSPTNTISIAGGGNDGALSTAVNTMTTTGGDEAHNNLQPSLGLNFIIKT